MELPPVESGTSGRMPTATALDEHEQQARLAAVSEASTTQPRTPRLAGNARVQQGHRAEQQSNDGEGFWSFPVAARVAMVLAVLWVLSTRSWRLLLLLMALQFSAHLNA